MSEQVYRINKWAATFESAQTRKNVRALSWVSLPTKHDGAGYRRLIARKNGPAIYGAWCVILQVAAKCPVRGILASEERPLDCDDLEAKTGMPSKLFEEALEALIDPMIGWVVVDVYHTSTTPLPVPSMALVPPVTARYGSARHITAQHGTARTAEPPDRSATQIDRTEPGREESSNSTSSVAGSGWCEKFVLGVAGAMGALADAVPQRKSLYANARKLMDRADRDACLTECEQIARKVRDSGGSVNKWAVWQGKVNKTYPECKTDRRVRSNP